MITVHNTYFRNEWIYLNKLLHKYFYKHEGKLNEIIYKLKLVYG